MPSLQQLMRVAMDTVVRRAVWLLPKPVLWVLLVVVVGASYLYAGH